VPRLYVDEELHRRLVKAAGEAGLSVSDLVGRLVLGRRRGTSSRSRRS